MLISVSEQLLQFIVIGMFLLGLSFSLFDLIAFDKKNILFKKSTITQDTVEGLVQRLQLKRNSLDGLYRSYLEGIKSEKYVDWQKQYIRDLLTPPSRFTQNDVDDAIAREIQKVENIKSDYSVLVCKIPLAAKPEIIIAFMQKTIYTLQELFDLSDELDRLEKELDVLTVMLKERVSFLREIKIIDNPDNH